MYSSKQKVKIKFKWAGKTKMTWDPKYNDNSRRCFPSKQWLRGASKHQERNTNRLQGLVIPPRTTYKKSRQQAKRTSYTNHSRGDYSFSPNKLNHKEKWAQETCNQRRCYLQGSTLIGCLVGTLSLDSLRLCTRVFKWETRRWMTLTLP